MVRQYQVVLDPDKLAAYGIAHTQVVDAIGKANQETGGSVLELGEAEYVVRASGYLQSLDDFRQIPLTTSAAGVRYSAMSRAFRSDPELRRGIGELDGEGEATGGVIVMRSGKNALQTIAAVKEKLQSLQASLPKGVEIVPVYDRSGLIERAVDNLTVKLIEEFLVVAVVCFIFLFHLRSAFVAIVSLPLGILAAFIVMYYQGVNANIMSLGGIAIAIGAMVDAAVVMIENAHKHLEHWNEKHPGETLQGEARWQVIGDAAAEVGPALLLSADHHAVVHSGVHARGAGGKAVQAAGVHQDVCDGSRRWLVTLIPVLMGYLIADASRPKIPTRSTVF